MIVNLIIKDDLHCFAVHDKQWFIAFRSLFAHLIMDWRRNISDLYGELEIWYGYDVGIITGESERNGEHKIQPRFFAAALYFSLCSIYDRNILQILVNYLEI